jgi:hypothetical protein
MTNQETFILTLIRLGFPSNREMTSDGTCKGTSGNAINEPVGVR